MTAIDSQSAGTPLQFAVIKSASPVQKRLWLNADGGLARSAAAFIREGEVRRGTASDLRDFSRQLDGLGPCEAVTYGLPVQEGRIVTKRKLTTSPDAIARDAQHFRFAEGPGILFLDHDAGLGLDELLPALFGVCPPLAAAPQLWRPSSSAGVRGEDGRWLTYLDRWHGYIAVEDARCIPAAGEALQALLWAAGEGFAWVEASRSGLPLDRGLLDGVHQAERLDFAAAPQLGPGLTRARFEPFFLNEGAPLFDLRRVQAAPEALARAAANKAKALAVARPSLEAARADYVPAQAERLARRRGLSIDQATRSVARAVDRQELQTDFELQLADGTQVTVGDVLADRARYHGVRLADPLEPDYRGDTRIAVLYTDGAEASIYSHAHGGVRYTLRLDSERVGFGLQPVAAGVADVADVAEPGLNAAQLAHLQPMPASEDALALQFAEQAHASFRWTPGPGWMVNTGPVWARDESLRRFETSRRLCRTVAADAGTTAEKRRLASAKTVAAVLQLAQSDPRITVPADAWDADPFALNTPAGVVDLRDGTLHTRAQQLHTRCTAVGPDMVASCPVFERFLADVFRRDAALISFAQRMLGYSLTGDRREQVLFFWHGSGANGKSVLLDLTQWILGTYSVKLGGQVLMTSRSDRHPTEIAQLKGRRLACSSELEEGAFFNEPLLKELTGDSVASARFMHGDFFEFAQTQKHVVVGNFKPRLRGGDPAMARRIVLVPFEAHFPVGARDPLMLDKLKAEGPAVLAWMIRGALAWQKGGLCIPEPVAAASGEYLDAHDDLKLWREERCTASGETRASELYADFARWKAARGEHAPSGTVWFQRLEVSGSVTKRRSNGIRYTGISLKPAFGGAP